MVIKDFRCPQCEEVHEVFVDGDQVTVWHDCGTAMERVFAESAKHFPFKVGWYEHIDLEPIYISSKRQLRRECEKRGVYSEYADMNT